MSDQTIRVTLSAKLDAFVREKVEAGEFADASGVLCEALQLMQAHEAQRHEKLEWLCAAIDKGVADLASGRFTEVANDDELSEFFARLSDGVRIEALRAALDAGVASGFVDDFSMDALIAEIDTKTTG